VGSLVAGRGARGEAPGGLGPRTCLEEWRRGGQGFAGLGVGGLVEERGKDGILGSQEWRHLRVWRMLGVG